MRTITQIIIHCSATPPTMDIGADVIRDWHVNGNGWQDIGYNYVIRRNGDVEPGRDLDGDGDVLEEVGAHAYGFNAGSVGICMVGGINSDGDSDSNFTFRQYASLKALVDNIVDQVGPVEVLGHRDLPGVTKDCPSFDVRSWWAQ